MVLLVQVSWTSPAGGGSLRPGLAHQRRPQTHRGDAGGEGDSGANACDHDMIERRDKLEEN